VDAGAVLSAQTTTAMVVVVAVAALLCLWQMRASPILLAGNLRSTGQRREGGWQSSLQATSGIELLLTATPLHPHNPRFVDLASDHLRLSSCCCRCDPMQLAVMMSRLCLESLAWISGRPWKWQTCHAGQRRQVVRYLSSEHTLLAASSLAKARGVAGGTPRCVSCYSWWSCRLLKVRENS
jgi:hypothetical protein